MALLHRIAMVEQSEQRSVAHPDTIEPTMRGSDRSEIASKVEASGLLSASRATLPSSLWHLLKGRRIAASLQSLSALCEGLVEAAILVLIASLGLDFVGDSSKSVFEFGPVSFSPAAASFWLVGLVFVRLAFALYSARLMTRTEVMISRLIRLSLLGTYMSSDGEARRSLPRGTDQQALTVWPQQLGSLCGSLLAAASNVVIMASMLLVAVVTEPMASVVMVLAICIGVFLFLPIRRRIRRLSAEVLEAQSGLANSIYEAGNLVTEAEIFGVKDRLRYRVSRFIEAEARSRDKVTFSKASISPLYTAVVFLIVALALVTVFTTQVGNVATYGPVLLLVIRSISYGQGIQRIGSTVASLRPLLERLRTVESQLLDRRIVWGSERLPSLDRIELANVSYLHADSGRGVRNISFSAGRGARIGLVGPSGGGKTTIVRLLLGELEPQSGQFLVNGVVRERFLEQDFRRLIVGVPQFPHLVDLSLTENVRFFRSAVSDYAVAEALRGADFELGLESGLGLSRALGEHSMSGGQVQRIGLARALAGDPGLLILDEPTSAVDQESQSRIIRALRNLPSETTVVVISHRPEVLELCSTLFFVKDGVISSVGTPHEILGKIAVDEEVDYGVAFGRQDT